MFFLFVEIFLFYQKQKKSYFCCYIWDAIVSLNIITRICSMDSAKNYETSHQTVMATMMIIHILKKGQ